LEDYERAFELQHKAIVMSPDDLRLRLYLAELHNDRAIDYERLAEYTAMEKDLMSCLKILEQLREPITAKQATGLNQTARRLRAMTRQNLGNLYAGQKRFDQALVEYAAAGKLAEDLCADEPGQLEYEFVAAKSAVNRGYVQFQLKDLGAAETTLK